jgi:hypothetical protein
MSEESITLPRHEVYGDFKNKKSHCRRCGKKANNLSGPRGKCTWPPKTPRKKESAKTLFLRKENAEQKDMIIRHLKLMAKEIKADTMFATSYSFEPIMALNGKGERMVIGYSLGLITNLKKAR